MLTIALLLIAALVAAVLIYAATRPATFRISRSATIHAAPEAIFPLVNDLRAHRTWSPFDRDANMKRAYKGPETGKGSVYEFDGGNKSGAGSLAITDATAPSQILMRLAMTKPLRCDNVVEFTFEPRDGATVVTWAMYGPNTYAAKLMNVFVDCSKMCERQFDEGLARLKSLAEADRLTSAA